MPRYKLTIEYDGTPFSGWQMQANAASIQSELARAIQGFCGERVVPKGAGRTDAGVHARGQVAHLDLERMFEPATVRDAVNAHLRPSPIVIVECEAVPPDFDARFSAKTRHYLYRIVNRRARLGLDRNRAWHVSVPLESDAMQEAAQILIGRHDFTTFRAAQCQAKSPIRTLDALTVMRDGGDILISASARSFLHHQVRSMVGSLKHVGEGKWTRATMVDALAARDRNACGAVAPACGLYFMRVDY